MNIFEYLMSSKFKPFKFEEVKFGADDRLEGNFRKVFETERFQEYYYTMFVVDDKFYTLYYYTKSQVIEIGVGKYNPRVLITVDKNGLCDIINEILYILKQGTTKNKIQRIKFHNEIFGKTLLHNEDFISFCVENLIAVGNGNLEFK